MLGGWEFRFVQIRGWSLLGPNKSQKKECVNKNLLLMNHWPNIVLIVELDPQATLTIRLPLLSKNFIHYDVR